MTEITEDIVPAVKVTDVLPKEITAEDFQKQLFSWFQDKGLMAELRSHLRVKMIGILKNASVECKVRNSFSPKLQAVNLLIAEYLLYKEYHYSLSVFSTEVPLANEFQDYSLHDGRVKKYKFSENDMWDILEILGITNDSDEGKDVRYTYFNESNTEPLLTCVIRTLHNMNQKSRTVIAEVNNDAGNVATVIELNAENKDHVLLKSITNLLVQAKVTPKYIADITEQFSQIIRTEIDRISEQKRKECLHIKQKIKMDSKQRIEKYKEHVVDVEKAFALERERLHSELEKSKADIQECALQLQIRTDGLNEKERLFSAKELDLVVKEDATAKKEKLLTTKEANLAEREDRLHTELQALYIEKLKLNEMRQRVRKIIPPHKSDKFCLNPQTPQSAEEQTPCNSINKEQQTSEVHNIENVLLKQTIRQLHLENENLRGQMNFQNTRIGELTQQTNNLTVEIAGLHKSLQDNHMAHATQFRNLPPPPRNSFNYVHAFAVNAGGDKRHKQQQHNNFYKNNQQQFEFTDNMFSSRPLSPMDSTCSSPEGESPTDNILKAAKVRLMTLEKESREIEKNFEKYRSRPPMGSYNNHPENPSNNKSNLRLVEKLNSNIAIVRENISRLIFDTNYIDADALLNEEVERVTTCTATPCAVEFRGNFSYNSLVADIPGSEYNLEVDQDCFQSPDALSVNEFNTDTSDNDHENKVEANVAAVCGE